MRRVMRLLVLAWITSACSTWTTLPHPVTPVVDSAHRETDYRITLKHGTTIVLQDPQFLGDSIVGWTSRHAGGKTLAVSLADVSKIEERGLSAGRTAGLVVGIAVAAAAALLLLLIIAYGDSDPVPY
jgi:hypothetical protein